MFTLHGVIQETSRIEGNLRRGTFWSEERERERREKERERDIQREKGMGRGETRHIEKK